MKEYVLDGQMVVFGKVGAPFQNQQEVDFSLGFVLGGELLG